MIHDQEIWKDIPGYEGFYQASNLGNVRSLDRVVYKGNGNYGTVKSAMKVPSIGNHGYYYVNLYKECKYKSFTVHQILAMTFLNHVPSKYKLIVDHIDNNPLNNNLSNLQIITQRRNCGKDKVKECSKYVGVSKYYNSKNFKAHIRIKGKNIKLGTFENEYDAHLAYQNKLRQLENNINN